MSFVAVSLVVAAGGAAYSAYRANELYGNKPDVPAAPTIGGTLQETLDANIAGLPKAGALAGATSEADQAQRLKALRGVLGTEAVDEIPALLGEKYKAEIMGKISPDVLASIRNYTAAGALKSGVGTNSGVFDASLARNYGLTSLDISNQGANSYKSWLTTASQSLLTPQVSASSFFFTPGMGQASADRAWQINNHAANVAAAPDPGTVGAFNTTLSMLSMLSTAYAGTARGPASASRPWLGSAGEAGSGEGRGSGFDFGFGGRQGGMGGQWYWGDQPGRG